MSPLLIAGIALLAGACVNWMISGPLSRFVARTRPYTKPGDDVDAYRKRKLTGIRTIGVGWAIMGLGICILSIIQGK